MPDDTLRQGNAARPINLPLAVVRQPDPMLDSERAGLFKLTLSSLGAAVIVAMVLYGLSRAPEPEQMATVPAAETNGSGQASPGAQPSTTGQGQSAQTSPEQSQTSQGKSPRADSSTKGKASAPSDQPAQSKP
jgi:hypothetical protein